MGDKYRYSKETTSGEMFNSFDVLVGEFSQKGKPCPYPNELFGRKRERAREEEGNSLEASFFSFFDFFLIFSIFKKFSMFF